MRRRMVRGAMALVFGFALVDGLFGGRGFLANRDLRARNERHRAAIAELSAHNDALAAEITRLREDPQAVEELAREELGLLKDGELLVILRDVAAPSPLPDAARAESSRPRR